MLGAPWLTSSLRTCRLVPREPVALLNLDQGHEPRQAKAHPGQNRICAALRTRAQAAALPLISSAAQNQESARLGRWRPAAQVDGGRRRLARHYVRPEAGRSEEHT